jgi:hypothetical protein
VAKHPWYRVTHIFAPIYRNEDIRRSVKKQESQLEADRRRIESYQLLDRIKTNQQRLELVADDLKVDTTLRVTARKSVVLENKIFDIRKKLRSEIRAKGGNSEMTYYEATISLQRTYRGYRIRRLISLAYVERTIKVWDKSAGRGTS